MHAQLSRRAFLRHCALLGLGLVAAPSLALNANSLNSGEKRAALSVPQAQAFRDWLQLIVKQQLEHPTPRWVQRDCAGLVRFSCAEALRAHSSQWVKANGLLGKRLPPELNLSASQLAQLRHTWLRADGSTGAFVGALELVQHNANWVSKNILEAQTGDLLLFDQGQEQHLMIWMGRYLAYHTGSVSADDNGMRAYDINTLMHWRDTRWRPREDNPNFIGIFRLFFLRST